MKMQSAFFLGCALALAGCAAPPVTVSGTVTLDGEPIKDGQIAFIPQDRGTGGGGTITQGQYSAIVPRGKLKVQIMASKKMKLPEGQKSMYGKDEEVRSYIPAKYNANTELTVDLSDNKTDLNFELKSK